MRHRPGNGVGLGEQRGRLQAVRDPRTVWRLAGLVPSQNSSGGKARLWRITKHDDDYLRTLLIQGAKSAVMTAHKWRDCISKWLVQLTARVGWYQAVVARANKNARILWAVLAKGRPAKRARLE